MPPKKPGPDPDQTTPNLPVLRSAKVWETGVAPDDTRIPGTRRLWLAGALALAVVSSCVTAITLQGSGPDEKSRNNLNRTTSAGDPVTPSLSLPPASPTTAPDGKSGLSEPQDSKDGSKGSKGSKDDDKDSSGSKDSDSSENQQGGAKPTAEPSKTTSPPKKPSTTAGRSVRSVNYPDRYWHLRSGAIQLDQVSSSSGGETREDSTFQVVSGLANSSCYSFRMSDGRYVRHQNFVLRPAGNDGSGLFKQDATFCPRSAYSSGTVILESVNYPGYFVRHRSFTLRLERYEHSGQFFADATFKLVKGFS